MPRIPRVPVGGQIYHVMNRAHARVRIFGAERDYRLFENLLGDARQRFPTELLAYSIMPNHWHLLLRPRENGELSGYMHWLTTAHTQRYHQIMGSRGGGAIYKGRFKSVAVENEGQLHAVWRYIDRNPLTAGLVERAADWRWGSGWWRYHRAHEAGWLLSAPIEPDIRRWMDFVDRPFTAAERENIKEITWNH